MFNVTVGLPVFGVKDNEGRRASEAALLDRWGRYAWPSARYTDSGKQLTR